MITSVNRLHLHWVLHSLATDRLQGVDAQSPRIVSFDKSQGHLHHTYPQRLMRQIDIKHAGSRCDSFALQCPSFSER